MGEWQDVSVGATGDPAFDLLNFKMELNRRLKHALRNIDISQLLLGLSASRIVSTNGSGTLASVSNLASWIAGTSNRITVTNDGDGTVTLSTPQDTHTAATPTFVSALLSGLTASRLVATDGTKTIESVANLASFVAGTANRITVANDGDGTITISAPQDLHTGASVTFANVTGSTLVQGAAGKFGDVSGGDYSAFEADGTYKANGDATTWDDLNGSALALQQTGPGVSRNAAENTADFTTAANLSDYLFDNYQVRHKWKAGSVVNPHIHWEQAEDNVPNFLIRYRWQRNGQAKTTGWTDYPCNTEVFTYVSGTLNQICHGAGITPPVGYSISDIIEFRVFRDNANTSTVFTGADPYTATVSVTFVDIHIEEDTLGSRTEYTK